MKKYLLSLAVLALAAGASAQQRAMTENGMPITATPEAEYATRATDGYDIKFCGDIYSWYNMSSKSNMTVRSYIYVTPELATKLAGNQLTSITMSGAGQGVSSLQGNAFVAEGTPEDVVTMTEGTFNLSTITSSGSVSSTKYTTIALDEPYEIKAGQGFYFGYQVDGCSSKTYPCGIDQGPANKYAGTTDVYNASGDYQGSFFWEEMGGVNLYLYATTIGDVTAINDFLIINADSSMGDFTMQTYEPGNTSRMNISLKNAGSNTVKTVGYTISVNGVESEEHTANVSILKNRTSTLKVETPALSEGRQNLTFNLKSVNGEVCEDNVTTQCFAVSNPYDRKFVAEEGTGTWCGYCPRGIVGMDYMAETYPDTFIGIAIHAGDSFACNSYAEVASMFPGYPSAVCNRDPLFLIDPSKSTLQSSYDKYLTNPAVASIDLTVAQEAGKSTLTACAKTTFALDDKGENYAIAFAVTEDGLTGTQTNYYSGQSAAPSDFWKNAGQTAKWTYTDTARAIYDCLGLPNSLPATIVKGQENEFYYEIPKAGVKDVAQTAITALLLDVNTGVILNAIRVHAKDYTDGTGITSTDVDNVAVTSGKGILNIEGAKASVYALDGSKVATGEGSFSLQSGVYIVVANGKSHKVVVR